MSAAEIAPEPQQPRLRQHDITIERVTTMLATAAPKGLLVVRMSCRDGAIDRIQEYGYREFLGNRTNGSQCVMALS